METYKQGQRVRLDFTLEYPDDTFVDATVVCSVKDPAGTVTTPAVVHDSAGHWHSAVTCSAPGRYAHRWVASGAYTAADEEAFRVLASEVI